MTSADAGPSSVPQVIANGPQLGAPGHLSHKFALTRVARRRARNRDGRTTSYPWGLRVLSTDTPVVNDLEFAYLVNISVGGQDLPVLLDTGSSDLWVVSTSCVSYDCQYVPKFNPANSSTLSSVNPALQFKLSYLMGAVEGSVAVETVAFGPYQISNQVLALAETSTALHLEDVGNSGILGLGPPGSAVIPDTVGTSMLTNLLAPFHTEAGARGPFFAFKLARSQPCASQQPSACVSSFTLGALDPDIVGPAGTDGRGFLYTNVSSAGTRRGAGFDFWKLPLHAVTINSVPLAPLSPSRVRGAPPSSSSSSGGGGVPLAVLDTGTTLILGPSADVRAFWARVGSARWDAARAAWLVRCERGVAVSFVLGDADHDGGQRREYALHPADISWNEGGGRNGGGGKGDDGWCMGGLQPHDGVNSGDWLLGDVFLRNVYVTHHLSTASSPPLIGLLNMTDPTIAMAEFRAERGPESNVTAAVGMLDSASQTGLDAGNSGGGRTRTPWFVFALLSVGGFVAGGIVVAVAMLSRRKRSTHVRLRSTERKGGSERYS